MKEKDYYIDYLKRTMTFPQSVYHKAKHDMVRAAFAGLPPGSRVLDAGCGIGHVTGRYCGQYNVVGVDEQPVAIQYCQKNWKGTYVRGDLYTLSFENDFFDLIVFLDAIEHLDRPMAALCELARVLKPKGRILICTMNYANPLWFILENTWHRFFGGTCKPYSCDVHPIHYTEKLLREHCAVSFKEIDLKKRIMGMELFYVGENKK